MPLVVATHDLQLSSPHHSLRPTPTPHRPVIPSPPPSPKFPQKSNSLFEAAIVGNLRGFLDALSDPAVDVNVLDGPKSRRNVLFCALVGTTTEHPRPCTPERVAILKVLVARPDLSLYVLNSPIPTANGLTPLALACSIGTVEQTLALLECPSVLVDARDARGATPLMYAARKGRVEIVQHLVLRGARPDLQDLKYKSAIEHAKKHANVLWQLENQLRRQRKSRLRSPSEPRSPKSFHSILPAVPETAVPSPSFLLTSDLIQETSEKLLIAIFNEDVSMLQAVLNNAPPASPSSSSLGSTVSRRKRVSVIEPPQPTLILNCLDANGYAPLHHAVMCRPPSIAVVEALYFAGADVNLRTAQGKSPLHVLAQYATGADEDEFVIRDFVLNFVHQFKASLACADTHGETCLHVAAERGASPFVLAGLLQCDEEGRMREMKNARGLRPVDVVKPEYRHVFGFLDPRPDSVCTLRPLVHVPAPIPAPILRPQQSFASISTIDSESTFYTDSSPERNAEPLVVCDGDSVTADEASQAARQLLEDLEFTSLQRHLFFKKPGAPPVQFPYPPNPSTHDFSTTPTASPLLFPPTPPATPPCDNAVIELQRLTAQVTAYWRSCLGRLQEELDRTQQSVEKSRRAFGKVKDEVDKRHRDGERENMNAIALWAAQEKRETREQSRHRSFTAPSSTAPPRFMDPVREEGDGDAFTASWQPRGYITDAGENGERPLSSLPSTPLSANTTLSVSSFFEKEEHAHELVLLKKTRRLTSLIKAKLLPHTRRAHGQGQGAEPPAGARISTANASMVFSHSSAGSTPTEEHPAPQLTEAEAEAAHSRHAIDIGSPVPGSPPPIMWSSRSTSFSGPASGQQTPRGALRKAPVVFSRVTAELGRIDEYMHGINALLDGLDGDLVRAQELIELTIAPCASPHPTDDDAESVEEAADAQRIKALRALLLGGLESRVTYAITGLDEVHRWNGLIRSLLRDFKRKLEGGFEDDPEAF